MPSSQHASPSPARTPRATSLLRAPVYGESTTVGEAMGNEGRVVGSSQPWTPDTKLNDLRRALKERGLNAGGSKLELWQRLQSEQQSELSSPRQELEQRTRGASPHVPPETQASFTQRRRSVTSSRPTPVSRPGTAGGAALAASAAAATSGNVAPAKEPHDPEARCKYCFSGEYDDDEEGTENNPAAEPEATTTNGNSGQQGRSLSLSRERSVTRRKRKRSLITPCECRGSMRYVHRSCLATWLTSDHGQVGSRTHCSVCKAPYRFRQMHFRTFFAAYLIYRFIFEIFTYAYYGVCFHIFIFFLSTMTDPTTPIGSAMAALRLRESAPDQENAHIHYPDSEASPSDTPAWFSANPIRLFFPGQWGIQETLALIAAGFAYRHMQRLHGAFLLMFLPGLMVLVSASYSRNLLMSLISVSMPSSVLVSGTFFTEVETSRLAMAIQAAARFALGSAIMAVIARGTALAFVSFSHFKNHVQNAYVWMLLLSNGWGAGVENWIMVNGDP